MSKILISILIVVGIPLKRSHDYDGVMITRLKEFFTKLFYNLVKIRFNLYAKHYEKAIVEAGYLDGELAGVIDYVNKLPNLTDLQVLEIGCGQGFAGRYLNKEPNLLVGIDISQAMLDRIDSNSKYDELHCAEILTHLKSEDRTFDLIYAASVTQFLNPTHLSQVSHLVRDSLTNSGEFVFTFDLRKSGYGLNSKGFWEYSIPYLKALLTPVFKHVAIEQLSFSRTERGKEVKSGIVVAQVNQEH